MARTEDEKRIARRIAKQRWEAANPEAARASNRKSQLKIKYGISVEDYHKILAEQGGRCAICRSDNPGSNRHGPHRNWPVDHDHSTGKVRGLLCSSCNLGLGKFNDSIDNLTQAIEYLKGH